MLMQGGLLDPEAGVVVPWKGSDRGGSRVVHARIDSLQSNALSVQEFATEALNLEHPGPLPHPLPPEIFHKYVQVFFKQTFFYKH